jgi:hypothetical protein
MRVLGRSKPSGRSESDFEGGKGVKNPAPSAGLVADEVEPEHA